MSAAHAPDSVILRESLASTERLISETISRAEDLRALALLPDLEKCSLAAARASDCLAADWSGDRQRLLHDLRNHIGAISGYLELLLEEHTHDARVMKKARRVITVEDGQVISDNRKDE